MLKNINLYPHLFKRVNQNKLKKILYIYATLLLVTPFSFCENLYYYYSINGQRIGYTKGEFSVTYNLKKHGNSIKVENVRINLLNTTTLPTKKIASAKLIKLIKKHEKIHYIINSEGARKIHKKLSKFKYPINKNTPIEHSLKISEQKFIEQFYSELNKIQLSQDNLDCFAKPK